jgi:hypothetical protein
MPISDIVSLLIEERNRIDKALEALGGPARRLGRPRKGAKTASAITTTNGVPARSGGKWSASARKDASERMRAYWAAKRKDAKASKKS